MYTARGTLDHETTLDRYGPMVRRIASQLIGRLPANVDFDDLVQAGMIGLFDAMSRFEGDRGAQFETFATQRRARRGARRLRVPTGCHADGSGTRKHRVGDSRPSSASGARPAKPTIAAESSSAGEYQRLLADARGASSSHRRARRRRREGSYIDAPLPRGRDPVVTAAQSASPRSLWGDRGLPDRERLSWHVLRTGHAPEGERGRARL